MAILERKTNAHKPMIWGVAACVLGLGLVALTAIEQAPRDFSMRLLFELLKAVGPALFTMGIFGMILDLRQWKDYFEDGLRGIVIRADFIKQLNRERMVEYEIEILKKFYQDEDIDREGRFLRYCLEHIHNYLAHPYREEISDEIEVQLLGSGRLRIEDDLDYVCRRAGGRIQEELVWQANRQETIEMEALVLELDIPGEVDCPKIVSKDQFEQRPGPDGSLCFVFDLQPYADRDGLKARFKATYTADASSFNSWRMMVPSRDVKLTIHYPKELDLQVLPFLLEEKPKKLVNEPGFYLVRFDSWVMPKSGFAWKLLPRAGQARSTGEARAAAA